MAAEKRKPVKIIGVFHNDWYWKEILGKEMDRLTKSTRRLGIELSDQRVKFIRRRRSAMGRMVNAMTFPKPVWGSKSILEFWSAVVKYADERGIEVVPLEPNRLYAVSQKVRKRFGDIPDTPQHARITFAMRENAMSRRINLRGVDTAIIGGHMCKPFKHY